MKQSIIVTLIVLASAFGVSCGDFLHDTDAVLVTLEVENLPVSDGTYAWAGDFLDNGWSTDAYTFDIAGGSGSYDEPIAVVNSELNFSITNEGDWGRPWYEAGVLEGNIDDFGSLQNFGIDIVIESAIKVITVDGSTNPVTLLVDGVDAAR